MLRAKPKVGGNNSLGDRGMDLKSRKLSHSQRPGARAIIGRMFTSTPNRAGQTAIRLSNTNGANTVTRRV